MDIIVYLVCEFCKMFQQFTGQSRCNHCGKPFSVKVLTQLLISKDEFEGDP